MSRNFIKLTIILNLTWPLSHVPVHPGQQDWPGPAAASVSLQSQEHCRIPEIRRTEYTFSSSSKKLLPCKKRTDLF